MKTPTALRDAPAACSRPGLACLCAGVSFAELDAAVAADRAASVESLGAALGCGVQCGSCIPAIEEALGEQAWFAASAMVRPITRSHDLRGLERLIYKVEITLQDGRGYPAVAPGQHLVLRARTEHGLVERTYTVVGQDVAAGRLTLAVRRKPEGRLTPWLLGEDGAVRRIEVSRPGGPGLQPAGTRSVVFFAGGVGITPAVAMAGALAPWARMHLDYSVTDADDAAFLPRFEARCKDRSGFSYALRQTALEGHIRAREVKALAARHRDSKFYICGPGGYAEHVHRSLRKAGVPASHIHVELFALTPGRAPANSFRLKAYAAGALLTLVPALLLLPAAQELRPHGHPNIGHEQLKCAACHVASPGSTRQVLQAKVKHAIGLRRSDAVLGMQPVTTATCIQCHANADDRHAPNRFLEPRFAQARQETGAQLCVSCHREHSGARFTAPGAAYCASCHQEMKVEADRTSPTHEFLVRNKRWDSCLQCHDYHGNHRWAAPLRLQDAPALEVLHKYLKDGPSPYGDPIVKAKQDKPS